MRIFCYSLLGHQSNPKAQKIVGPPAKHLGVPPPPIELVDYLSTVLDLTSGSKGLMVAFAKVRYSSITVKLDKKQVEASAAVIKKIFQKDSFCFLGEVEASAIGFQGCC
jgi:hypothetical protein